MIFMEKNKPEKVTFSIDKEADFSDWYSEIIARAELADLRYNVKGFLVFQPWSVLVMEKMYDCLEKILQESGHNPYWYPAVIPEKNFRMEAEHVAGFAPQVFWVTETGSGEKLEERLALRPTSETAFYQMFALWIRSYKDLPFKTYQRAQVFRYETKATRPFLRGREFYWIEAHDAFATEAEALKQVREDMETTRKLLWDFLGIPFIFFQRPQWDKFAGAVNTYAADSLLPDGKVIQLPSTHNLGQNFAKPFGVKFRDKDGKEKNPFITCYGPAVSRIFASLISVHGDSKGLRFPFEIAPKQIVIVPIARDKDEKVLPACQKIASDLRKAGFRVELDSSEKMPGEKFYFWEMKGVPLRIELGPKELKEKKCTVYRRDIQKKELILLSSLEKWIQKNGLEATEFLKSQSKKLFDHAINSADSRKELETALKGRGFVKVNFCSDGMDAASCAETVEKDLLANVRGSKAFESEKPFGSKKCVICGKPAKAVLYIGKQY